MPALKIVMLVDAEALAPPESRTEPTAATLAQAAIFESLSNRGFAVSIIPVTRPIRGLIGRIHDESPDVIFNLALPYDQDRRRAAQLAALLDLLNIPYTGSGPQGILRACDRALSRHAVRMLGGRVPRFSSIPPSSSIPKAQGLAFPMIVKPGFDGGPEATPSACVVRNASELRARVAWIHRTHRQSAVCEEFIEGRGVSIGLIGNRRPYAFTFREQVSPSGEGEPQFAPHRTNYGRAYRVSSKVRWKLPELPASRMAPIKADAERIYAELQLRDYARIDFRLARSGELFFLRANHRPHCTPTSFGMFAARHSMEFHELLEGILACCLSRHKRSRGRLRRSTAAGLRQLTARLGEIRALIQ